MGRFRAGFWKRDKHVPIRDAEGKLHRIPLDEIRTIEGDWATLEGEKKNGALERMLNMGLIPILCCAPSGDPREQIIGMYNPKVCEPGDVFGCRRCKRQQVFGELPTQSRDGMVHDHPGHYGFLLDGAPIMPISVARA